MLSRSQLKPCLQGGQDGNGCILPGEQISDRHTDLHRLALWLPGDTHESAHGLDDEIIAGFVAQGSCLPKAGDRTINETGVDRGSRFEIQGKAIQSSGAKVLNENITSFDQFMKDPTALLCSEIHHNTALVAINAQIIGAF